MVWRHPGSDGRVIELALGANNLVGTLPAALGHLDQMQWLYLWGNQLTGAIPGARATSPTCGTCGSVATS